MPSILILMRISNLILMRWFQVLGSREVYPDSGHAPDSRSAFSRRKIYRLLVLGACQFVLGWRRCLVSSASCLQFIGVSPT